MEEALCRICREEDELEALLTPCACKGSVAYVHRACLLRWVTYRMEAQRPAKQCELCRTELQLRWCLRPLSEWDWQITLSAEERTKLNIFMFSYVVAVMGKAPKTQGMSLTLLGQTLLGTSSSL